MSLKNILILVGCLVLLGGSSVKSDEPNNLTIGSIASLTGYGSFAGNAELQGTTLAVEEINKKGGIRGKQVSLVSEDNQSDQKQTITTFRKLKAVDNAFAIIGPNWSEFASPIAPLANSEKTILITPTGHTPTLLENRPYVFSLQFPAKDSIRPVIEYLESRNFSEIIIFVSSNAYYEMLAETILTSFPKSTKIHSEMIPADSLDFRSNLNKLKNAKNVGIVVFLLENGPAATFVKQAKSIGIPAQNLMLGPIVKYDDILKKDKTLSEGLIHFDYNYEIPKDFNLKFKQRFSVEPTFGSAQAYDAVNLLKNGIDKCGFEKEKLVACLTEEKFNGISGPVAFRQNRDRITTSPVIQVFSITEGESKRSAKN